jgi:hypothetical protein
VKSTKTRTGFELGAKVLQINVEALVRIYELTISVTHEMVKASKVNAALSYFGVLIYADLLHGGAYLTPINNRPYYVGEASEHYAGTLQHMDDTSLADLVAQIFAGSAIKPKEIFNEVLTNANCPHVFPKLLSDEAYALLKASLVFQGGADLFGKSASGLATLVEAESKLISATGSAIGAAGQGVGSAASGIGKGAAALAPLLELVG